MLKPLKMFSLSPLILPFPLTDIFYFALFLYNVMQTYIAGSLPATGIQYSLYLQWGRSVQTYVPLNKVINVKPCSLGLH